MSSARALWLALACLAAAGCASWAPGTSGSHLPVARGVTMHMAPISFFDEPVSVSQLLWIERDGETQFLHVHIELGPDRIGLAAFDGLGVRLFSLVHDGYEMTIDKALSLPPELPVELMLGDLVLAFAPEATLRARLRGARLVSTEDGARRELFRGTRRLATVEQLQPGGWSSEVIYTRHDLGYRVTIRTLDVAEP